MIRGSVQNVSLRNGTHNLETKEAESYVVFSDIGLIYDNTYSIELQEHIATVTLYSELLNFRFSGCVYLEMS